MDILVRNAEGNLSQHDRDYASKKFGHLDRYFNAASRVEIVHRAFKNQHRIEVTVFADGLTFRGDETDESINAAIDKVASKMEHKLRKFKKRLIKSHRQRGRDIPMGLLEEDMAPEVEESTHEVVEHKSIPLKPMSMEEATLQMELLGHPFFMFRNEETGQTEVLYKRKDGQYGLLQPGDE